jgi:hypothetical protein
MHRQTMLIRQNRKKYSFTVAQYSAYAAGDNHMTAEPVGQIIDKSASVRHRMDDHGKSYIQRHAERDGHCDKVPPSWVSNRAHEDRTAGELVLRMGSHRSSVPRGIAREHGFRKSCTLDILIAVLPLQLMKRPFIRKRDGLNPKKVPGQSLPFYFSSC